MKLGLFSWYGYEAPIARRLEHIHQAGFTSTMLWWGDEQANPEIDADLLKRAVDLGISIENVHVPFADANWLWAADLDVHRAYWSRYIRYADFCAEHRLSTIVVHVSKGSLVAAPSEYGIDTMRRLSTYCLRSGVSVALENTGRILLIEALLDAIDNKNLGLCYDTSHGRLYEETEFQLLKKYPHRLKCLHISDNDGVEDRHWMTGQGVIDWESFVRNLPTDCECQTLSLEVCPRDKSQDEKEFLEEAFVRIHAIRESVMKRTS